MTCSAQIVALHLAGGYVMSVLLLAQAGQGGR